MSRPVASVFGIGGRREAAFRWAMDAYGVEEFSSLVDLSNWPGAIVIEGPLSAVEFECLYVALIASNGIPDGTGH